MPNTTPTALTNTTPDFYYDDSVEVCHPCPSGSVCEPQMNSTLTHLKIDPGFYRGGWYQRHHDTALLPPKPYPGHAPSPSRRLYPLPLGTLTSVSYYSTKILECFNSQVCIGGFVAGDDSCADGYTGPRCATCDTGHFKDTFNQCSACRDAKGMPDGMFGCLDGGVECAQLRLYRHASPVTLPDLTAPCSTLPCPALP